MVGLQPKGLLPTRDRLLQFPGAILLQGGGECLLRLLAARGVVGDEVFDFGDEIVRRLEPFLGVSLEKLQDDGLQLRVYELAGLGDGIGLAVAYPGHPSGVVPGVEGVGDA